MPYDNNLEVEAIEEYNQDMSDMQADDFQEWVSLMEEIGAENEK